MDITLHTQKLYFFFTSVSVHHAVNTEVPAPRKFLSSALFMLSLLQRLNISFINPFFHPINQNDLCDKIVQLNSVGGRRGVPRP